MQTNQQTLIYTAATPERWQNELDYQSGLRNRTLPIRVPTKGEQLRVFYILLFTAASMSTAARLKILFSIAVKNVTVIFYKIQQGFVKITLRSQYDFLDEKVTETGKKSPGCPAMLNSMLPLLLDVSMTGSCHSSTECL